MTAISISASRGAALVKLSDFTVGSTAPPAGDFSVNYNETDGNGANITKKDLVLFLEGVLRLLTQNPQTPAGTPFLGYPLL